jgi:hypothetical protein
MAHPGVTKMRENLKSLFFWKGMKADIVNYVERCLECQQVEHRHPVRLLQPHAITESKWEVISMDFIVGLPLTTRIHDSIFVVVDTLTKSAHFILVGTTYQAPGIARVFISETVRLHGVPKRIISDRGLVFTEIFWTSFQEALGTQLNFSTAYHPEIDGKTKQTNQILEDMFVCMLWTKKSVGKSSCHWYNFCITTVIKAPLRWRLSSFFTGDHVRHLELGST